MDWGSLAGIALALAGILIGQLLEGGHLDALVQPAAFMIVVIGTIGAVLLQSGMPVFLRGIAIRLCCSACSTECPARIRESGNQSTTPSRS